MRYAFSLLVLALATSKLGAQVALYDEPYRPGYHYTPEVNWTNEPNGLVYSSGTYHLFYQANPFNNQFGNQTWGHATSVDLVNWQQQPAAILPDLGVLTFSGSAVVDENNTSGFGAGAMVALYTGFQPADGTQDQRLAFSNDNGGTWTKRPLPVIPKLPGVEGVETRDPKVFWHQPTSAWKMVLSHGGQKKLSLWTSSNLRSWTRTQDFTSPDIAAQLGGYEVPDLFPLPVKDNSGTVVDEKWVLSMTPSSGSPASGNGVNYWVGEYDGTTFTSENPLGTPLWADFGRDFDGQQSWSNTPDGRVIWTGVMQTYGESVPTTPWRGQMALPRELSLIDTGASIELAQQPIAELQSLRGAPTIVSNASISSSVDPLAGLGIQGDMLEIKAKIDLGTATSVRLRVREGLNGDQTDIGYTPFGSRMFVDRTSSGDTSFSGDAGGIHFSPLDLDANGHINLHVFVDSSSVEVFGGDGRSVISNLIFPDPSSLGVSLVATGGTAQLVSFEAYPLNSIWDVGQPTPIGTSTIARWSMDAVPQAIGVPWEGPVSIDSRTRLGEGSALGTGFPNYEPNPAVENLWSSVGNGTMATSAVIPPQSMFTPGNDGGGSSYDAAAIVNSPGALHLPDERYGDEAAFTDAFSVEMFFRTDGDQSQAGLMQLLLQGTDEFRYGIIVNEGGAGNVRFAINDKAGQIPLIDINSVSNKNYADGEWHYLLATYDPSAGTNGELRLTIANEDGTADTATVTINAAFAGLPAGSDGDLLIGRHNTSLSSDPRNFLGLIDEVQLSAGLVPDVLRLGALPGDTFLPGDFNRDGTVDAADYAHWRNSLGAAVIAAGDGADANGNGVIDHEDLETWRASIGQSSTVATPASQPVPEPASLIYTVVLYGFSFRRRCRDSISFEAAQMVC